MRVQAVLLTSTKETISLLILSSQRVPLKTCKACNYCGEYAEYQEKKKKLPYTLIIFNYFYDHLEIFLWENFPSMHSQERNRKAKGPPPVTEVQSIHSTDAATDVNHPSLAQ